LNLKLCNSVTESANKLHILLVSQVFIFQPDIDTQKKISLQTAFTGTSTFCSQNYWFKFSCKTHKI